MKNIGTQNIKRKGIGLFTLCALSFLLLTACGDNTKVKIVYGQQERYSVGDATIKQPVSKINIDWYEGMVDIRYSDSNVFRIREDSDSVLTDSLRMRYCVSDDGELDIRFCQSGTYRHGQLLLTNKRLWIEVPHDANLDDIEIDMVGGVICYDSVRCRELTLNVVNVATTVWTPTLPDEIDVDAVKATLRLYVQPTAGMTIEMEGIKTTLDSKLPVGKEGKNTTIIGDGHCKIDVDAVSSSVYINELKNE